MINVIKIILLVICFVSVAQAAETQTDTANMTIAQDNPNHALGFSAGYVVGNGIIYRRYSGNDIFQTTFAGLVDKEKNEEYLNLSASYARYLNKFNYKTTLGLKAIIGGEAIYDKADGASDNRINIGSGIGVDIGNVQKQGLILSFDLIYTAGFESATGTTIQTLSLKAALGLMYNFQ